MCVSPVLDPKPDHQCKGLILGGAGLLRGIQQDQGSSRPLPLAKNIGKLTVNEKKKTKQKQTRDRHVRLKCLLVVVMVVRPRGGRRRRNRVNDDDEEGAYDDEEECGCGA